MADPSIRTRNAASGGRPGAIDRRPLLLVAVGVLAAVVLVAMVWRLDRTSEPTARRRLVDLDRIVVPASPTDEELETPATEIDRDTIASLREGASVQVADEDGRLAQEYGAARIDPLPDEWIAMARPWARFHPDNGRLVEMTANDGTLRVPERAIESGRLEGDVRIRIFEADATARGDDRVPAVEIEAEIAEYDAAAGRLDSPGRIRVRTAEASFEGEDLRVLFGEDGATIERLTVERALGPIEIRRLAAITGPGGNPVASTPPSTSDPGTTRAEASPAGSASASPTSSNPTPPSAVSATSTPSAADAWRARGDAPEPTPADPPSPVVPDDVYRVVLDRDVVIERFARDADGEPATSRIEGDRLTLVLSLASGGMDDAFADASWPTPEATTFPKGKSARSWSGEPS